MWKVLVVDDEHEVASAVQRRLEREGYEVVVAHSEHEGIAKIRSAEQPFDVVITDMVMEHEDSGMNVLLEAVKRDIFTEVIVLTAYGNVANAVESMKRGAFDYVEKNIPGVDVFDLLAMKVAAAADHRQSSVGTIRRLEEVSRYVSRGKSQGETKPS
jgi:DNA-binding NtrC family response regulator